MIIPIVYEDGDILVINKPANLLTHPKNEKDQSESIVGWLIEKYPNIKNVGDHVKPGGHVTGDSLRPGIVHRLDKNTSGLLIIAKTQPAFLYFKNLFQERKIEKKYIAMVYGSLEEKSGIIESPLGKIGSKQTTRIHGKKELKIKEAITEYRVLKRLKDYSLLEVSPKTGRTHQIRIHLNSIGHPIVGDDLYGKKKDEFNLNRLFLHAFYLKFISPSGKAIALEADLPDELNKIIASLEK